MKKYFPQIPSLKKIWRIWLGSQSPRRPILKWPTTDKLVLLIVCLLIAIISSYKLLAVPDLKPGDIAPFNITAPKDALVKDKQAISEKKLGLAAKERNKELLEKVSSKPGYFRLKSYGVGKYGRVLGEIFIEDKDGKQ